MPLTLEQYPDAIAAAEVAALEAKESYLAIAEAVENQRAEFKAMVAEKYPPKTGNDRDRASYLAELEGSDPQYQEWRLAAKQQETGLELARIEVRRLERMFRVAMALHGFPE
jgi:hypothetical protein